MPEWAVREMLADWLGAGRAYEGKWPDCKNWTWLDKSIGKMRLHPKTLVLINKIRQELLNTPIK